jgi:hypothetical protein
MNPESLPPCVARTEEPPRMETATDRAVPAALAAPAQTGGRAIAWARRNAHSVTAAALYASVLGVLLAQVFVQDSWLAIAGGRDIAEHGLPWHERLTTVALGAEWVDQQWLGKLSLYGLAAVGGVRMLAVAHVLLVLGAVYAAMTIARRRGATDPSVFWVSVAVLLIAPWSWQLRTQGLAYVLFVAVVAVVTEERIRPAIRVMACAPILALWANVHGSVTLGAVLVAGAALCAIRLELPKGGIRGRLLAGLAALVPVACLFASPYGFHLLDYYHSLLGNPLMGRYIDEWRAPTFRSAFVFFALAAVVLWLVARHGRVLTTMERWALLVTGLTGFMTIRGIVWFGLAAVLVVPKLLDERSRREAHPSSSPLLVTVATLSSGVAIALLGVQLAHLPRVLGDSYPGSAARVVGTAVDRDETLKVFASERYADWLLWKEPQLAGKIVYDVRFELFDAEHFAQLAAFHDHGTRKGDITDGARLLVLDRLADRVAVRALTRESAARILYEDANLVVILRKRTAALP